METHGGGSRGAEAAHHLCRGRRTGGHGKALAFCPGRQGAQQGGDGGHHGDVGRQRTP
ncbi:MAG: hypothetical protein Q3X19_08055 [Oscillospiraceae bacterium]|nr:hypothetical protein [Oscillospiraceae bacterium]